MLNWLHEDLNELHDYLKKLYENLNEYMNIKMNYIKI